MIKLCIMYLTDSMRHVSFPFFLKQFSKCKYLDQILLFILTNDPDVGYYHSLLHETGMNYRLAQVPTDKNYLRKLKVTLDLVKDLDIPYIMKHDNDILMSSFLYDYLFENLSILEDPNNLVLTPTLTSGIPTCDLFLEDFCSPEEREKMGSLFLRYQHGPLWGTDYSELNKHTLEATTWNAAAYYASVKQRAHHYKGIHPVRMDKDSIEMLNQLVLQHKDRIFSKQDFTLFFDKESPYFCNSIFCIKSSVYSTILYRSDLYVDNFDEVPLNKWRDMHGLNLVIVRNGTAIHPYYNSIDGYISKEQALIRQL